MTPVGAAWICGQAFTKRIRFKVEEVLKLRADKWEKMLDMNGSEPAKICMKTFMIVLHFKTNRNWDVIGGMVWNMPFLG